TLEVAVHLGLDDSRGDRHVDGLEDRRDEDITSGVGLVEHGPLTALLTQVLEELVEGVELARELSEVVVGGREVARLDRGRGDGDVGLFARTLPTRERGTEGRGLPRRQARERFVEALEHRARTDLVADAGDRVD